MRSKGIPIVRDEIHLGYRLALWKINQLLRRSVTIKTRQGTFNIPMNVPDPINKSLYLKGEYELEVITSSISFLRSIEKCPPKGEGTILDIGANNGCISIAALTSREFDKAITIEPAPQNYSSLVTNIGLNELNGKTLCLNVAVSDTKSVVDFELSPTNYGDHRVRSKHSTNDQELFNESDRQTIQVPADRIDHILEDIDESFYSDISIMWIDIQGFEGYAFLGAEKLLSQDIPVVAEIWPYGIQRAGMSQDTFCNIARDIWSDYWVLRGERFIKYPINMLDIYFDEIGHEGNYNNVIFTK